MNTVFTFYNRVPQLKPAGELIELWRESWSRNGWNPVVLGLNDAQKHPLYADYVEGIKSKAKSINPGDYDLMCWVRWLALDVMGGGLMTDYDVINRNLKQNDLEPAPVIVYAGVENKPEQFNGLRVYEISKVPCCVSATQEGATQLVQSIHAMPQNEGAHYSDMYWFTEQPFDVKPIVVEFLSDGWESAKAVHFCNGSCHRYRETLRVNMQRELIVRRIMSL